MVNLEILKKTEIILHFNKMNLIDANIPMWVIKTKGETFYVDHVDVNSGIGFSTKETPESIHTKGSLKFKGKLKIFTVDNKTIANIFK